MNTDLSGGIDPQREYFFAERPDGAGIRDALNVWIEEATGAFALRLGVESLSDSWEHPEIYLDIGFPDGRVLTRRTSDPMVSVFDSDGKPSIRGAGPLSFRCIEPFKRWSVAFDGSAFEISAAELIKTPYPNESFISKVQFEIEMAMAAPPWVAGSLLSEAAAALKSSDQADFISPRYEQLFRATGKMQIGEEHFDIDGQGLRVRRQGTRKFEGFWGHCWMSCLFPSGKAFAFNVFPPRADGKQSFGEGYVYDGTGPLRPAKPVRVPWLTQLRVSGDEVLLELETDSGRTSISGTSFINTRGRFSTVLPPDFPPDFPIIQQSHVRYCWDGETSTGMMERSTPPSGMEL